MYKRQLYNQGCLEEFINALVEKEDIYLKMSPGEEKVKAHQKMVNYIEAVSYTHLDVYKRQVPGAPTVE